MIAAIHAARKRKREAQAQAAAAAHNREVACSDTDCEESTPSESACSYAPSEAGGDAAAEPAPKSTALTWEDIAMPPPKGVVFCLPRQLQVYQAYQSQPVQIATAVLIVSNFIFNIAEKEFDPYVDQLTPAVWKWGEFSFNMLFLIELLVNFYGLAFAFWRHNPGAARARSPPTLPRASLLTAAQTDPGWNIFDLLVVCIGCVSMAEAIGGNFMPPQLALIRNLRAFRIFRLFKRVKSLNKILTSLGTAIPGVFNAFVIQVIVMCIYAILGVDFFHMTGEDGTLTTYNENVLRGVCTEEEVESGLCSLNQTVSSETARGFTYGEEYYGTFFRALYTLFQVLTGESWSEMVARPAIFSMKMALGPALFYVSFIVICQIVLINVVVAVLLDKMVTEDAPDPEELEVVDKLQRMLAQEADRLQLLFRSWDEDGSGTVSKREWRKAIRSLGYRGPSSILDQIFDSIDRDRSGELEYAEIDQLVYPKRTRRASVNASQPKRSAKEEVVLLRTDLRDDVARLEARFEAQLAAIVDELRALRKGESPSEQDEPDHGPVPLSRLVDAGELSI